MGGLLVFLGLGLVLAGLLLWAAEAGLARSWRLPGDFEFGGRGWRVAFPLATSIVVSVLLTLVLNVVLWLARRR